MSFTPINQISSAAIPLLVDHVDTDQIIPARFLKATNREGFGVHLFDGWRYLKDGLPNPEFVLNTPAGQGQILFSGENFGCGSSREHAAWALYDYGIRVVIARSFADIFSNNAMNNGILPITLRASDWDELKAGIDTHPEENIEIDLPNQKINFGAIDFERDFEINAFKKKCLMEGTDLVDYLINQKSQIETYEQSRN